MSLDMFCSQVKLLYLLYLYASFFLHALKVGYSVYSKEGSSCVGYFFCVVFFRFLTFYPFIIHFVVCTYCGKRKVNPEMSLYMVSSRYFPIAIELKLQL